MIEAFHSNWTAPFFMGSDVKEYYIEDFEILTTIISALKWREKNGSIKMITDEVGAEYYNKINIASIWDLGIEISLNTIPKYIDANIFWAAGKIYSLQKQKTPCAMIDTDFIVWKSMENVIEKSEICTVHKETISSGIYPNKDYFLMKEGYSFDSRWNWNVEPCNTAFAYIRNSEFKDYYTKSAIEFMSNLKDDNNKIINMVFAEQRLISMCAKKMNLHIDELLPLSTILNSKQTYFTHLWGYKNELRGNYKKKEKFCLNCIKRIIKDFPHYEDIIANIPQLKQYYIICKSTNYTAN